MTARELACRYVSPDGWPCGAQAGEDCSAVLISGRRVPIIFTHAERKIDAATMTSNPSPVSADEFDKAIEEIL